MRTTPIMTATIAPGLLAKLEGRPVLTVVEQASGEQEEVDSKLAVVGVTITIPSDMVATEIDEV